MSVWAKTVEEAADHNPAHIARYLIAKKYVTGKRVCDVACGTGYGCRFLSDSVSNIVGMDISAKAIEWANEYFLRENIRFIAADLTEAWPVTEIFGAITSFETMEHVVDPEKFLSNIYDHLEPDGVLVLSVPNGPRDKMKTDNPNHLHHFTKQQLEELFGKVFPKFEFFTQTYKKDFRHYMAKWMRKLKLLKKQPMFVDNYYLAPGLNDKLKTWVVIARK